MVWNKSKAGRTGLGMYAEGETERKNSRSKSTSTGPEGGTDGENGKPDNPEIPDRYAHPGDCPAGSGLGMYAEG